MLSKSLILTFFLALFISTITLADENISNECVEKNLLLGLQSDNTGLQLSCAYYLGECKSHAAVLPLMKLLRSSKDENLRIIAALSLIKIGDARGVYLVERTSIFDDSETVRKLTNRFYLAFKHESINDSGETDEMLAFVK